MTESDPKNSLLDLDAAVERPTPVVRLGGQTWQLRLPQDMSMQESIQVRRRAYQAQELMKRAEEAEPESEEEERLAGELSGVVDVFIQTAVPTMPEEVRKELTVQQQYRLLDFFLHEARSSGLTMQPTGLPDLVTTTG